ncbi:MAG: hypothetical protein NHG36_20170 [Chromatiaceae bacterium]|nr:hypothetical protein [Candidatus Thioaporhodococcus sediminis]
MIEAATTMNMPIVTQRPLQPSLFSEFRPEHQAMRIVLDTLVWLADQYGPDDVMKLTISPFLKAIEGSRGQKKEPTSQDRPST